MEANVPEAERERAGEVLVRILNGALFELAQPDAASRPAWRRWRPSEKTQAFMTQAVLALSDVHFYPAPVVLQLKDFKQVQASVFQVARAPGQEHRLPGLRLADPGRFCHAVRARAPALVSG